MSYEIWEGSVGQIPYKVTAFEMATRGRVLYLRWRKGNWKYLSLKRSLARANLAPSFYDEDGKRRGKAVVAEMKRFALNEAQRKSVELASGVKPDASVPTSRSLLTIGKAKALVTDPHKGKFAARSNYRREVEAALDFAARVWRNDEGDERSWNSIRRADIRLLGRRRMDELVAKKHVGYRGAEITVQRVLTVAQWLRDEELIDEDACVASSEWKDELRKYWSETHGATSVPDPKRPRHTLEEMRRILVAAHEDDPRFGLLLAVGAELRLGQVRRSMRSDLNLDHATLRIRGSGQKKGVLVELTDGQMRVVRQSLTEGYLRILETACADYPLFPRGQLPGGRPGLWKGEGRPKFGRYSTATATVERHATAAPVGETYIRKCFMRAEKKAGVPYVKGRGGYGIRRVAVDTAKSLGISREGLQAHGGWSDTQVPDSIYADQEMTYARKEARDVRAKIRGEGER